MCGTMLPTINSTPEPSGEQPKPKSLYRRHSIAVSLILHAIVLVALLCWYIPRQSTQRTKSATPQSAVSSRLQPERPMATEFQPNSAAYVLNEDIRSSLSLSVDQVKDLSTAAQLNELEKNLQKLQANASPESVEQTTDRIAEAFGLVEGPVPNPIPPEGIFDISTAQIHDITRQQAADGKWTYQSVLVDKAGRTQSVELPSTEGKATYNTFQQLKKFPLAEGIYRKIVMPMLQNTLSAAAAAEEQARKVEQQKYQDSKSLPEDSPVSENIPSANVGE